MPSSQLKTKKSRRKQAQYKYALSPSIPGRGEGGIVSYPCFSSLLPAIHFQFWGQNPSLSFGFSLPLAKKGMSPNSPDGLAVAAAHILAPALGCPEDAEDQVLVVRDIQTDERLSQGRRPHCRCKYCTWGVLPHKLTRLYKIVQKGICW